MNCRRGQFAVFTHGSKFARQTPEEREDQIDRFVREAVEEGKFIRDLVKGKRVLADLSPSNSQDS